MKITLTTIQSSVFTILEKAEASKCWSGIKNTSLFQNINKLPPAYAGGFIPVQASLGLSLPALVAQYIYE